jgi:nitrate/nitrite transporter NarK
LIGFIWAALILPILGWTSDKIGQIRQLIITLILLIIFIISYFVSPALSMLVPLVVFIMIYQTFVSSVASTYLPVLAGMFPAKIRFTGVALCYNLAYAIAAFFPAFMAKF